MSKTKEWFGEWFDAPYYHILYKNRDVEEARKFIDKLIDFLHFDTKDHIMDLACGKGRHAIYLNSKGYRVTGLDLSVQNISLANRYANEKLQFFVHDMREVWEEGSFDYILNLFTSFGYFDSEAENEASIVAAATALRKGGKLLIDFLNPFTVVHNLVPEEYKTVEGINFHIRKWLREDDYIIKDISFEHAGKAYHYQEKVKAIQRKEFLRYFDKAGLRLIRLFGDYDLNPYQAESSERMIFLLENC